MRVKLKFANGGQIQVPDAEPGCKVVLLLVVAGSTIHDKIRRENEKGEGEKNKKPRKKFSHSKFLKQKLRQKIVKISTGLT